MSRKTPMGLKLSALTALILGLLTEPSNAIEYCTLLHGQPLPVNVLTVSVTVPAAGVISTAARAACLGVGTAQVVRTYCRVGQDGIAGRFECGEGAPAGCTLDSFIVAQPSYITYSDGTRTVCVTGVNSQPYNVRYFDLHVVVQ